MCARRTSYLFALTSVHAAFLGVLVAAVNAQWRQAMTGRPAPPARPQY